MQLEMGKNVITHHVLYCSILQHLYYTFILLLEMFSLFSSLLSIITIYKYSLWLVIEIKLLKAVFVKTLG